MKNLLPASVLTKAQGRHFTREFTRDGTRFLLDAHVRYDDSCGNGHNTFSITGVLKEKMGSRFIEHSAGCIHDEIVNAVPELAPYIKWHLCSSDGPMHYLQNSLYLAGDRDCWGKRKGEPKSFETKLYFDAVPIAFSYPEKFVRWLQTSLQNKVTFEIKEISHEKRNGETYDFKPKYSLNDFAFRWYECPFDSRLEAEQFKKALECCTPRFETVCVAWGEGKEPELEKAREAAIWPEAQLEDFTQEKLLARLPTLMQEFKRDVESLGFIY